MTSYWKFAVTELHKNMLDNLLPQDRADFYRENYFDILEDDFLRICRKERVSVSNVAYSDWHDAGEGNPYPSSLSLSSNGVRFVSSLDSFSKVEFDYLPYLKKDSLSKIKTRLAYFEPLKDFVGFKEYRGHMCFVNRCGKGLIYKPWISFSKKEQLTIKSLIGGLVLIPRKLFSDVKLDFSKKFDSATEALKYFASQKDYTPLYGSTSVQFLRSDQDKRFNASSLFPFLTTINCDGKVQHEHVRFDLLRFDEHVNSLTLGIETGNDICTSGEEFFLNEPLARRFIQCIPSGSLKDSLLSLYDGSFNSPYSLTVNVKNIDEDRIYSENVDRDVDFTVLFSSGLSKPLSVSSMEECVRKYAGESLIVVEDGREALSGHWFDYKSFINSLPDEYVKGKPCSLNIVDLCSDIDGPIKLTSYESQAFDFLSEIQKRGVVVDKIVCSGNKGFELAFAKVSRLYGIGVEVNVPLSRANACNKELLDFKRIFENNDIINKVGKQKPNSSLNEKKGVRLG